MQFSKLALFAFAAIILPAVAAPQPAAADISPADALVDLDVSELAVRDASPDDEFAEFELTDEQIGDLGWEAHTEEKRDVLERDVLESRKTCAQKIIDAAKTQGGKWYKFGAGGCGSAKKNYDCSGLTAYAVCKATGNKKKLPHKADSQYRSSLGKKIARGSAKPGDLVFWGRGGCKSSGSVYHVAIWLGKNKIYAAQKTGTKIGTFNFYKSQACPYVRRIC